MRNSSGELQCTSSSPKTLTLTFPAPSMHVKGIPIVTYEGILHGISTRILLYKLAQNLTFNNKAILTLAIESFFASVSKADFTMTGCPKATQIQRILPNIMQFNSYKYDPEKKFCIDSRQGAPYLHYDLENRVTIPQHAQCDDIQFKATGLICIANLPRNASKSI